MTRLRQILMVAWMILILADLVYTITYCTVEPSHNPFDHSYGPDQFYWSVPNWQFPSMCVIAVNLLGFHFAGKHFTSDRSHYTESSSHVNPRRNKLPHYRHWFFNNYARSQKGASDHDG